MSELQPEEMQALLATVGNPPTDTAVVPRSLARILDLPVTLRVELGRQRCSLNEVLALGAGKLLELSHNLDQPLEVRLDGQVLALGRVVVVGGGKFGVEIVTLAPGPTGSRPATQVRRAATPAVRVVPEQLPEV